MMIAIEKKIGRPTSVAASQRNLSDLAAILAMFLEVLLRMPENIFCHHDPCIDEHADGDCDTSKGHDVG